MCNEYVDNLCKFIIKGEKLLLFDEKEEVLVLLFGFLF